MKTWKDNMFILHLEDNIDDRELLEITLKKAKLNCSIVSMHTEDELQQTDLAKFDAVITDYNLGSYNGLAAIKLIRSKTVTLPIILLSGTVGDELAADLLRSGANDFVLKSNLKKVPIAIQRALQEAMLLEEKHKFQRELIEKNLILDTIFDSFENQIFLKDTSGRYIKVNRAFCDYLELSEDEIIGKSEQEIFPDTVSDIGVENDEYVTMTQKKITYEIDYVNSRSERAIMEVTKTPIVNGKKVTGIVGECRNITKHRLLLEDSVRAQSILNQAERLTKSGSFEYDSDLDLLDCSINFKNMMNLRIEGNTISFKKLTNLIKEEDRAFFSEGITKAIERREEYFMEHRFNINVRDKEDIAYFNIMLKPDFKDERGFRFYGTVVDITSEREIQNYMMKRQEDDRKEIARELHDNLGQKMNAISMFTSKLSEQLPDSKEFEKVRNLVHESIDDLSFMINNISVKQVEDHSLDYAVTKLIGYMPDTIKINNNFQIQEELLSPFVKSQVYRVIQEALNNVAKYSEASEVNMDLVQDGSILSLNIEDDGKGFEVDKVLSGNGLQNITHRVRKSNGLINIDSEKGKGTRVKVKMPVS